MKTIPNTNTKSSSQSGMALVMVMMVIALASIIVVNVAYSTSLGSRLTVAAQRTVQAEYLLKSAVNLAVTLIKADTSPEDAPQDPWGPFKNSLVIPTELLEIDVPNVRVQLEIRPENSKIPLQSLGASVDIKWRDALARLFVSLGFDDDKDEVDESGLFPDRHFNAKETVAILIDYQDLDNESYPDEDFVSGFQGESTLPENSFPNRRIETLTELSAVPGFTAKRRQDINPLVSTVTTGYVNINTVPRKILKILPDPEMGDAELDSIIAFRDGEDGPFTQSGLRDQFLQIVNDEDLFGKIRPFFSTGSSIFQVVAKVDYGTSNYFIRAYVSKGSAGATPKVRNIELY